MQEHLLRKLIEKNYFCVLTEVNALLKGYDIGGSAMFKFDGTYTVTGLYESRKTGKLILGVSSVVDGTTHRIGADDITMIDAMTPERFAENYLISPDGSDIKIIGKRRGRRPNNWVEEEFAD